MQLTNLEEKILSLAFALSQNKPHKVYIDPVLIVLSPIGLIKSKMVLEDHNFLTCTELKIDELKQLMGKVNYLLEPTNN